MNQPKAYILHGHCGLPTDTSIYAASMAVPNRTMHVRRNTGQVSREDIAQCGVTIEDDVAADGFVRIDILGAKYFNTPHEYFQKLISLGLTKTDFHNLDYGELCDRFGNKIGEGVKAGKLLVLYGTSPSYDFRESSAVTKIQARFSLHLEQDRAGIDDIIQELAGEDGEVAPVKASAGKVQTA